MSPRANRIKALRGLRGLTAQQVAERMGVVKYTIYRWEKSQTRPTDQQIDDLAHVLGTTVPFMMGLVDDDGGDGEQVAA